MKTAGLTPEKYRLRLMRGALTRATARYGIGGNLKKLRPITLAGKAEMWFQAWTTPDMVRDRMSTTETKIIQLIDRRPDVEGKHTETNRWLVEGVELLLRSVRELREELRDQGILR